MNLNSLTTKMHAVFGPAPLSPLLVKAFHFELPQFLHVHPRIEPTLAAVNVQRTTYFGAS